MKKTIIITLGAFALIAFAPVNTAALFASVERPVATERLALTCDEARKAGFVQRCLSQTNRCEQLAKEGPDATTVPVRPYRDVCTVLFV